MAAKRSKKSTKRKTKTANERAATPTTRKIRPGFISHTELASADPAATKAWAEVALGWKFVEPMPTPGGPYHMWRFDNNLGGGGIRANSPPENPGSIPYVEVPDIRFAYDRALKAGAMPLFPPDEIPGNNGWLAIVQAPGRVAIGFWGPK